jgi:C4-dicarboxylate transporter DctQ subunit
MRFVSIFQFISGACMVLIFSVMLAQVIMRYVFGSVPFFVEEVSRYLLIWGVLAGIAVSIWNGSHLRVDLLLQIAPRIMRTPLQFFLAMTTLAVYLIFAVYGFKLVLFLHAERSISMGLPLSVPSAAIPLFFGAAAVHAAVQLFRCLRGMGTP